MLDNGAPSASADIDDTMLHEYGHALQYAVYGMSWGRPTGCTCVNHGGVANDCSHDALVEGWASYFAVMLYNHINPSDTAYGWSGDPFTFDIESNANTDWEERDEWSVVGMLFDVYDSVNEPGDSLALGDDEIWAVMHHDNPQTVEEFFQRFIARYPQHATGLEQVFKTHGMNPDWLTLSTQSMDFGTSATDDTFTIRREGWYGDGVIVQPTWEITTDADWITSISPSSGSTTTETDTITVTIDRSSLVYGTHTDHITVTPTYYRLPQQITVTCTKEVTEDNYEPNDTYAEAYDLSGQGGAWLSELDGTALQYDDDWYEIYVSPAGSERVLVDCTFSHAAGNIDIALHDSSGALLTSATSTTDDEHIDYVVPGVGTYYIRVYGDNAGNSYDLRWECLEVPDLIVTSPNGGESWQRGTTHGVAWSSGGGAGANVKLELYKGGAFDSTITASTANDGAHSWPIDPGQAVGADYKVKVTSTSDPSCSDESDAVFAITSAGADDSMERGVVSADEEWVTVDLANTYTDPIVIAGPATYKGKDPGIVRVRNVTGRSFEIRFQEWNYDDGGHTYEDIAYMVVERGVWDIGSGRILVADSMGTNNTDPSSPTPVSFPGAASFTAAPVVVATQQTANGSDAVTERLRGITTAGFSVCLQEEEAEGGQTTETIGYVAVGPGTGGSGSLSVSLEAGIGDPSGWQILVVEEKSQDSETDHAWESIAHIRFTDTPDSTLNFVADMQTCNDTDTATLRCRAAATEPSGEAEALEQGPETASEAAPTGTAGSAAAAGGIEADSEPDDGAGDAAAPMVHIVSPAGG